MQQKSLREASTLTDLLKGLEKFLERYSKNLPDHTDPVKLNRFRTAFYEAYREIENKEYLDLTCGKFLYSTSRQVKYFAQFIPSQPDSESLLSVFERISKVFPEEFDIRAYSCGNAVKEGLLFLNEALSGRANKIYLHDYNDNVLRVAQDVVLRLFESLEDPKLSCEQKVITEDTTDIEQNLPRRHKSDKMPLVHLLLGNVISLVENPGEVASILNRTMRKKELLVVEWYDRTLKDYNQGKLFESNKNFLLNYFGAMGIPQEHIRFDVDAEGKERLMEDESGIYNQAYCFLSQKCTLNGLELKAGTKIVPMRLRRFKEDELIRLFEKEGLEAVVLREEPRRFMGGDGVVSQIVTIMDKIKWEADGDKRYALFRKVKDIDSSYLKGYKAGGFAALLGALVYSFAPSAVEDVHRYLWRNARVYQPTETTTPIKVEENIEKLKTILRPACKSGLFSMKKEAVIDTVKIVCYFPYRKDISYIKQEYQIKRDLLEHPGGSSGFELEWSSITSVDGHIPPLKRDGAVLIGGGVMDGTKILLLEREAIPRVVQLLEDTRKEIARQEAVFKEVYLGH